MGQVPEMKGKDHRTQKAEKKKKQNMHSVGEKKRGDSRRAAQLEVKEKWSIHAARRLDEGPWKYFVHYWFKTIMPI